MSSRSIATVITSDTIALNAAIFGYAGHSLVTPHAAIQQIFWTDERINHKVTRDFVVSKLRPDEKIKIFSHVSFGDDLTSCKYLDWVMEKAKRFFLILVEAGIPDKIFGIIDAAWTDEDLPIALSDVPFLRLSSSRKDDQLNHKFYMTQFRFLLRSLTQDSHIQYGPNEVVPLEYVHRLPAAAALTSWQKAHLPKHPNFVLVKRKVLLGKDGDKDSECDPAKQAQFLADIEKSRLVEHKHLAPVWASYTVKSTGFMLTTFEAEHTLKSFIDFRIAASVQKMTRAERTRAVMMWFHCLADALACIHDSGLAHTAIMPSNIIIDGKNHIAFSDIGCLKSFQTDKKIEPTDIYNYGAPENYSEIRKAFVSEDASVDTRFTRFSHRRGRSTDSRSKSGERSFPSAPPTSSLFDFLPPGLVSSKRASSTTSSEPSMDSPKTPNLEHTIGNYDFQPTRAVPPIPKPSEESSEPATESDTSFQPLTPMKTWGTKTNETPSPPASPKINPLNVTSSRSDSVIRGRRADIFSLGCVFLDLLTYLLRKKASEFTKHRTTKRKIDLSQPIFQIDPLSPTSTPSLAAVFATATASSSSSSSSGSPSAFSDSSFHANGSKLDAWIQILEHEAEIQEDAQFRAFPALVRITRSMLSQNAQLRPTAVEVRERVLDALVSHARVEGVCCKGAEELGRMPDAPKSVSSKANTVVAKVMPQIHSSSAGVVTKAKSFWAPGRKKAEDSIEEVPEPVTKAQTSKPDKTNKTSTPTKGSKDKISNDKNSSARPKTPSQKEMSSPSQTDDRPTPPRKSSLAHLHDARRLESPSTPPRPSTAHGACPKPKNSSNLPSTSHARSNSGTSSLTAVDLDRPLPKLPRKAMPQATLLTLTNAVFVPPLKKSTKTPTNSSKIPSMPSNSAGTSPEKSQTPDFQVLSTPTPAPKHISRLLQKRSAPDLRRKGSKLDIFEIPPPPLPSFRFDGRDKDLSKAQGAMRNDLDETLPNVAEPGNSTEDVDIIKAVPAPSYEPPEAPLHMPPPPPIPSVPDLMSQLSGGIVRSKSTKSTKSTKSVASVGTITVMHRLKSFTSWKSKKLSTASAMDAADQREKEEDAMIVQFPSVRLDWNHEDDDFGNIASELEGMDGLRIVLDHD